ncbi:unnamed protein product [Didymodactylos carnosus]|uniref:Uncharacterized protein n=1 Tax=Didymodactylos carnosus TaxID=1234261 RepID=A0A813YQD4_9BILA|nr:unnamed protein product [Didymodactylos carnosus]CAF1009307.1 unnamed protein product [Didymodactylos carnosus]CAF3672335.1 unnamed protein product [Didymodactylos carnosus]CAF3778099.1 unnamed protein product [Didymodactylos carnosus]
MTERVSDFHDSEKAVGIKLMKKSKAEIEHDEYMQRQHAILIGELKAAEARNRIRATRLRFSKTRSDEIDQIISFQPNALGALRFEAFMNKPDKQSTKVKDPLNQLERRRVQNLSLDDQNLLVDRKS